MIITCPSCVLRPLVPSDAPSLAKHANDRDVWLNLRDRFPHPYTLADAEWYIAHAATREPQTSFGITVDDEAVGSVSLVPGDDIARESAEIGYWLGGDFRGRGIMTDAVRAVTGYAFTQLKLRRVFAVPFSHNEASVRVLRKAGYVKEGTMKASAVKDGALLDQELYAAYDAHLAALRPLRDVPASDDKVLLYRETNAEWSDDELETYVTRVLGDEHRDEALALLRAYGTQPHEREPARVRRVIVQRSRGSMEKLRSLMHTAQRDYRDVLMGDRGAYATWEHPPADDDRARAPVKLGVPSPYLRVDDADRAIAFYVKVFGAREVVRLVEPGGRVAHAELRFGRDGDASLMLSEEYPESGIRGPRALNGTSVALQLYVENVDTVCTNVLAAGGQVIKPPRDDPFGDRSAKVIDPCGHEWLIATRKANVAPAEMQSRFARMFEDAD